MNFRPLTADDISACRVFWVGVPGLGLSSADEPEALQAFFRRNPDLSWGAFDGHNLVATVLAGHDGRRGFLYHLAVDEAYRGQGLSTELMRLSLEGLAKCGIAKVHAFVLEENATGLAFWAAAARRGWNRRGDVLLFSKNLP